MRPPHKSSIEIALFRGFALAAVMSCLLAGEGMSQRPTLEPALGVLAGNYDEAVAQHSSAPEAEAIRKMAPRLNVLSASRIAHLKTDAQYRVQVDLLADGTQTVERLARLVSEHGGSVLAVNAHYRNGILSAFVPMGALRTVSALPGVQSMRAGQQPRTSAGPATTQGATLLRSNVVNKLGWNGAGVTVGILSDSFNTASGYGVADTAAIDVSQGYLPDTTSIPEGEGLKYLIELDPNTYGPGTDEGRAMAEIVYGMAPGASLCFATGYVSDVDFAENIRALRTDPNCNADVIVDDIEYEDEPFFSDGMIAQAVDEVSTSKDLPGHRVAYFSAAGNDAQEGYTSRLRIVPDSVARSLPLSVSRINLKSIPSTIDTSGGFHNFNAGSGKQLAEDIVYADGTDISFQWDDPFDLAPSGITTSFNLLFFDAKTGKFLFAVDDDAFKNNEPIQLFTLNTGQGSGTTAEVLMAVARTGKGSHLAQWIKYMSFGAIWDQNGLITDSSPTTYGHNSAASANSVAAGVYNTDPALFGPPHYRPLYENYSSPGPVLIAFNARGERREIEMRAKPDIAAPDGVNTSFFPETEIYGPYLDLEGNFGKPDGFPNFFGTSAAVAHAAGVAALVVQKAGGPGKIAPANLSAILKASSPARNAHLFFSQAVAQDSDYQVTVTAIGDDSSDSDYSDRFFNVDFHSTVSDAKLQSLSFDLNKTGLLFDPTTFPVTVGSSSGPVLVSVKPGKTLTSSLALTFSGFTSGKSISFGVARGFTLASTKYIVPLGGTSADDMDGAAVSAVIAPPAGKSTATKSIGGTFLDQQGTGYRIYDGAGMIDAMNAVTLTTPRN